MANREQVNRSVDACVQQQPVRCHIFPQRSLFIAIWWWILPIAAYAKGYTIPLERIKTFMAKGCEADPKTKWIACFEVVDKKGTVVHEGLLIAVNDREIAFFQKGWKLCFPTQRQHAIEEKAPLATSGREYKQNLAPVWSFAFFHAIGEQIWGA